MPRSYPAKVTMDWNEVTVEHLEAAGEALGVNSIGEMAEWLQNIEGGDALSLPFDEAAVVIYLAAVQADPEFTMEDARKTGFGHFTRAIEAGKPKPGKNPPAREPLAKRPAAPARRKRAEAQAAT